MEFVLNRDKTHSSTLGHRIQFKKGEKTHVPPELWPEVQAFGAVPVDEMPVEMVRDTPEPADAQARKEVIFKAFEQIILGSKRNDFTGTGVPHGTALKDRMGFTIDNKERDKLWLEFQARGKGE